MDMNQVTDNRLPRHSNQELLSRVRTAVGNQPLIRALDLDHFTISVRDGVVYLSGHVRSKQLIEATVADEVGKDAIHSELVDDRELAVMVSQSLAAEPDTRFYRLRVEVNHGWVRIFGTVPSSAVQDAVASVAVRHPLVRGVIALPNVAGKSSTPARSPLQPPVRAEVVAAGGTRGRVQQVIINPSNRLVTHMVVQVQGRSTPRSPLETSKHIVPVGNVEAIGHKTIYLRRQDHPLFAYPEVEEADFPLPPPAWRPPYPYEKGSVRWLWKADWQRQPLPLAPVSGSERQTEARTEETTVPA